MKPVKWCPHCQSPNSADELTCLKCGYSFRVRITVEPDEPLHTFTPQVMPSRRPIPWKRAALFAGIPLALLSAFLAAGYWLSLSASQAPALRYAESPRFAGANPDIRTVSESPLPGNRIVTTPERHREAVIKTALWDGVYNGMTQQQVVNMIGEPHAEAIQPDGSLQWHYRHDTYYLLLKFRGDRVVFNEYLLPGELIRR